VDRCPEQAGRPTVAPRLLYGETIIQEGKVRSLRLLVYKPFVLCHRAKAKAKELLNNNLRNHLVLNR